MIISGFHIDNVVRFNVHVCLIAKCKKKKGQVGMKIENECL